MNRHFHSDIITIPDKVKLKKNIPPEDHAIVQNNVVAVCDGVTLDHQHPYQNPSPAAHAAKLAAETFVHTLKKSKGARNSLLRAFTTANRVIRRYNIGIGLTSQTVDFLQKQYAATVAAFGIFNGNILRWGQINDCGVMVLDHRGRIVMNQILDQKPYGDFIDNHRRKELSIEGTAAEHRFVRKYVVNNKTLRFRHKLINWGVMTGQPIAKHFLRTGRFLLKPRQIVLFYSDGLVPLLELATFRKKLVAIKNVTQIRRYILSFSQRGPQFRKEKTMVLVRPNVLA